jgi:hypothetical protein
VVANISLRKCLKRRAGFLACLTLAGCGGGGFDPNGILESHPLRLDGEQVMLNGDELDCGAREELWNINPTGEGTAVARLTQKGRDLQFGDDVRIGEPGIPAPYAQLRGSFSVKVLQVGTIHDDDAFTKRADAKVGVRIDHPCFQNYLPVLMGIRHGQFSASTNPIFRFKMDGEWMMDQILH